MISFIDYLEEVAHQVYSWDAGFEARVRAQRTKVEIRLFDMENQCYLCNFPFQGVDGTEKQKHFDHDHLTGHYRGAACAWCNRKMKLLRRTVPIYFHNYRGYDNHHIVHALAGERIGSWNRSHKIWKNL